MKSSIAVALCVVASTLAWEPSVGPSLAPRAHAQLGLACNAATTFMRAVVQECGAAGLASHPIDCMKRVWERYHFLGDAVRAMASEAWSGVRGQISGLSRIVSSVTERIVRELGIDPNESWASNALNVVGNLNRLTARLMALPVELVRTALTSIGSTLTSAFERATHASPELRNSPAMVELDRACGTAAGGADGCYGVRSCYQWMTGSCGDAARDFGLDNARNCLANVWKTTKALGRCAAAVTTVVASNPSVLIDTLRNTANAAGERLGALWDTVKARFDEAKTRLGQTVMSALQGMADLGKRVLIRGATTLARELVPSLISNMRSSGAAGAQRPAAGRAESALVTVVRPLAQRILRQGISLLADTVRGVAGISSSMTFAGLCAATGPAQPVCDCILSSLSSFALDGVVNSL